MTGCAVVTGASSGIGAAIARELAGAGTPVVAAARRADRLADLAASAGPGEVLAHAADLTDPAQVTELFAAATSRFGAVGTVVHSVGTEYPIGTAWEQSLDTVAQTVAALVTSPALVLHEALRVMRPTGGLVVMVSSGAADRATPGRALYSAAKAAVNRMVASTAKETAAADGPPLGVVAILLGRVDTPMQARLVEAARTAPAAFGLERFTTTDDVSPAGDVARGVGELVRRPVEELNGQVLRYRADGWGPA